MGALTTVYFRSTAVRFASAFAAIKVASASRTAATYSSYSSWLTAPGWQPASLATSQIGLGHLQLGLPDCDLGERLLVDGLVFVRLDREQRLAFFDEIAVFEFDRLQVAEDPCVNFHRLGCLGPAGVFVESVVSCWTTSAVVTFGTGCCSSANLFFRIP